MLNMIKMVNISLFSLYKLIIITRTCIFVAYCQQWEDLLTEGLNVFGNARNIVREYRMKLFAEEQLSRQMKP